MLLFVAQETNLGGPDIIGQANHGTEVVGRHQVVSDEYGMGQPLVYGLRIEFVEKVVGFQVAHGQCLLYDDFFYDDLSLGGDMHDIDAFREDTAIDKGVTRTVST